MRPIHPLTTESVQNISPLQNAFSLNMSLKVTSKMTHIGRYLYKGSILCESCATLTILTEKELHCHMKTYGNM